MLAPGRGTAAAAAAAAAEAAEWCVFTLNAVLVVVVVVVVFRSLVSGGHRKVSERRSGGPDRIADRIRWSIVCCCLVDNEGCEIDRMREMMRHEMMMMMMMMVGRPIGWLVH